MVDEDAVKLVTKLLTAIVWEQGQVVVASKALDEVPQNLCLKFQSTPSGIRVYLDQVDEAIRQAQASGGGHGVQ